MTNTSNHSTITQLLSQVHIQSGQTLIDFGCGNGTYTIPAADLVGPKGKVYAFDDTQTNLAIIQYQAQRQHLTNIEYINTQGTIGISTHIALVQTILAFDVLHYFDKEKRKKLYAQFRAHLSDHGTLVIYPKHTTDDWPLWNLSSTSTTDLIKEITQEKFILKETKTLPLIHDEQRETGTILLFKKQYQYF
jgi:cyclopropane fatty-acyl-phospholipid synthase-like methyltransferase